MDQSPLIDVFPIINNQPIPTSTSNHTQKTHNVALFVKNDFPTVLPAVGGQKSTLKIPKKPHPFSSLYTNFVPKIRSKNTIVPSGYHLKFPCSCRLCVENHIVHILLHHKSKKKQDKMYGQYQTNQQYQAPQGQVISKELYDIFYDCFFSRSFFCFFCIDSS